MSLRYMLDTDTVSFALRGEGEVGERLLERAPERRAAAYERLDCPPWSLG